MRNILFTLTIIAIFFACKNKEKVVKEHNNNQEETANVKHDTLVYMERSPCFGQCPTYSVLIMNDGKTTYHGKKFVEKTGVYTLQLTNDDLQQIKQTAKEIAIFDLKDKYDRPVTDIPSTLIIYKEKEKRKQIIDRVDAPQELKRFEKLIDALIKNKKWILAE